MLLPRILTAVIGIPLVLAVLEAGGLPFLIFVFIVCLFCLREIFTLFTGMGVESRPVFGYMAGVVLFSLFIVPSAGEPQLLEPLRQPPVWGFGMTLVLTGFVLAELFRGRTRSLLSAAATLFGVLLVTWPLAHLVLLRELAPLGRQWCLFLFVCIWAIDSAAYFVGRAFGARPLAPHVSPKKTIEGFLGGIAGGALSSSLLWLIFFREHGISYWEAVLLGALGLGVVSQLSDLVESMLKRQARVKDSSQALPGHGGFLDRFDSFILSSPLLYYYLALK